MKINYINMDNINMDNINMDNINDVLSRILNRYKEKFRRRHIPRNTSYEVTKNQPIFRINEEKVISAYISKCVYVNDKNEEKKHLNIKFISSKENATVHLSLLLDDYIDLLKAQIE
jgi:hypothetical protein